MERGFGIAQRKFQILCRPVEVWYEEDIQDVVITCFILHHMIVEVRMARDQQETSEWYELVAENEEADDEEDDNTNNNPTEEYLGRHVVDLDDSAAVAAVPNIRQRIEVIATRFPEDGTARAEHIKEAIKEHFNTLRSDWKDLYNVEEHVRLRDALMQGLEELHDR